MKLETGTVYDGVEVISMGNDIFSASAASAMVSAFDHCSIATNDLISLKIATVLVTQEVVDDYTKILEKCATLGDDECRDKMISFKLKLCRSIGFDNGKLSFYQLPYQQRIFIVSQVRPLIN